MATVKKAKLDPDNEDTQLAAEVAVTDLQEVQLQLEKLNDEASDKVLKVEEEYNKLRKPVYAQRSEVISKIPDFWYQCFMQHPFLADMLTSQDAEILTYLRQVTVEDFSDIRSGYKISFLFDENPYFSDRELSKSFEYDDQDGQLLCSSPGIHWHPGKDPSQVVDQTSRKRQRETDQDSFFLWFPVEDTPYHTAQDQIADMIKDHLWLNPLKYYLGDLEDYDIPTGEGEELSNGALVIEDEGEEEDDGEGYDYGEEDDEEGLEPVYDEGEEGQEYEEGEEGEGLGGEGLVGELPPYEDVEEPEYDDEDEEEDVGVDAVPDDAPD